MGYETGEVIALGSWPAHPCARGKSYPQRLAEAGCRLVGAGLLLAGAMKAQVLATGLAGLAGPAGSGLFVWAAAAGELLLGYALLSSWRLRAARAVGLVAFIAFFAVSAAKAFGGVSSCGCFGNLPTSPWLSAAFDLAAFTALFWLRPDGARLVPMRVLLARRVAALILAVALGAFGWILSGLYRPMVLGADGGLEGSSRSIVLQPANWVGRRLPLLPYTDIANKLSKGNWVVVLYRHGCPKCAKVVRAYEANTRLRIGSPGAPSIALVEIPPYGVPTGKEAVAGSPCLLGQLRADKHWLVVTPVVLRLAEGVVIAAWVGRDQASPRG